MGKITVWECEQTKKLFRIESEYEVHLVTLREKAEEKAKLAAFRKNRKKRTRPLYDLASFREIEDWLTTNWEVFHAAYTDRSENWECRDKPRIRLFGMRCGAQSCSHSAPLGKKTNWRGEDHLPKSYLGWQGRIQFDYKSHQSIDFLKDIGLCIGAGGGNRGRAEYDVTLWDDDFPMLRKTGDVSEGWQHDLYHADRLDTAERFRIWYKTRKAIQSLLFKKIPTEFPSEWGTVTNSIDMLARQFGGTLHRYAVMKADLSSEVQYLIQSVGRDDHGEPFALESAMESVVLFSDIDRVIEWKLAGKLNGEIIDLRERALTLLREGKIKSIAPLVLRERINRE